MVDQAEVALIVERMERYVDARSAELFDKMQARLLTLEARVHELESAAIFVAVDECERGTVTLH